LSGCGEPEDTRPGQPVAHRRAAFKQIIKSFEPMGVMLRDGQVDAARFRKLAADLARDAETPWSHFPADTLYPPSRATAEIWSDPAGFAEEKDVFLKRVAALQAGLGEKYEPSWKLAYDQVHDSCRSCHKRFKAK
jgi:cytochrome c556